MPRFTVVETIVNRGGGAVGLSCKILDTQGDGQVEYESTEFDKEAYRYVRQRIDGRWVDGFAFGNRNHADCMAAVLNLGFAELLKNDGSPNHPGATHASQ